MTAIAAALPEALLVPRLVTDDAADAAAFLDDGAGQGHEGVVVKSLEATYDAGPSRRRLGEGQAGAHPRPGGARRRVGIGGRRKGWLSNLHLGARDPETGGFVMLGKTFKGLTDEMLRWQTERS